jgi:hypothetical protein
VIENGLGLDAANALIPLQLWADPAIHEPHANREKDIVALILEGMRLCSWFFWRQVWLGRLFGVLAA